MWILVGAEVAHSLALLVFAAALGGLATLLATTSAKAQTLRKRFIKRERPEQSGYSLAVITEGAGKTIWLAGHGG